VLPDAVVGALVAGAQLIVWLSVSSVVSLVFADEAPAVRITATLVAIWSLIVAAALVLGTFGLLSPMSLYAVVLLGAVGGYAFARRARGVPLLPGAADFRSSTESSPAGGGLHWTWYPLVGLGVAQLVFYGLGRLPSDWDTLAYHLPIVDHWLQYGHLFSRDCAVWYVPGNNEFLAYWFVAPFSGDFWVHLNNVPVIVLLASSLTAVAGMLGLSPLTRGVLLTCVLCSQPVLRQIISAENDVAVAASFMAAFLFGWRCTHEATRRDLVWFALSIGLLGGVKYYALESLAVAVAAPVGMLIVRGRTGPAVRVAAAAAAGFAALSLFWYLRNYLMTGTPLYPKGLPGMPGPWDQMRPDIHSSTIAGAGRAEVWSLLVPAWLGQAGPVTGAAALLTPLSAVILLRMSAGNRDLRWLLLLLVLSAEVYLATPNVVESLPGTLNMLQWQYHPVRFGTVFLVVSAVAAAVIGQRTADRFAGRPLAVPMLKGVGVLLLSTQFAWHLLPLVGDRRLCDSMGIFMPPRENETLPLAMVSVMADALLTFWMWKLFRSSWPRIAGIVGGGLLIVVWAWSSGTLATHWHQTFDVHFGHLRMSGVYEMLDREIRPDDRLCACDYRYYPCLGSRRQRSVCRPPRLTGRQSFNEYLAEQQATVVLVPVYDSHDTRTYDEVREWIRQANADYELAGEAAGFELYRRTRRASPEAPDGARPRP